MTLTRLLLAASLIGTLGGCGEDEPASPPPTTATNPTENTAGNTNAAQTPTGPTALTIGGPQVALQVPAAPSFALNITEPGEYQIDVMSMSNDPIMSLYQGDDRIERDDDGGEGNNAQMIRFLAPGEYQLKVTEYHLREVGVQGQIAKLAPLQPAGTIEPGGSVTVETPRGNNTRAAAREVTLTIATAGTYQIDATSEDKDAQLALIQNNATLIEENSDGGDGRNARIRRQLQPGTYQVRVWDWIRRPASITVTVNPG